MMQSTNPFSNMMMTSSALITSPFQKQKQPDPIPTDLKILLEEKEVEEIKIVPQKKVNPIESIISTTTKLNIFNPLTLLAKEEQKEAEKKEKVESKFVSFLSNLPKIKEEDSDKSDDGLSPIDEGKTGEFIPTVHDKKQPGFNPMRVLYMIKSSQGSTKCE